MKWFLVQYLPICNREASVREEYKPKTLALYFFQLFANVYPDLVEEFKNAEAAKLSKKSSKRTRYNLSCYKESLDVNIEVRVSSRTLWEHLICKLLKRG